MKTKLTYWAALLGAALFTGCASTYQIKHPVQTQRLNNGGSVYLALPEDGRFENTAYPGSGRKTALALAEALKPNVATIEIASAPASFAQSLTAANGFRYLFFPTILHWEDRATEWSGRKDRIVIELRTVDVESAKTIDIGEISGKSKWATFGGDVPEDLLAEPLTKYVSELFGVPIPKKEIKPVKASSAK